MAAAAAALVTPWRCPRTAAPRSLGAPFDGSSNAGAVWAFTRSGVVWTQQGQKLTPSDEDNTGGGGWFGFAVALNADGDTALIGAPLDSASAAGAAWLFARSAGTWTQLGSKITASGEDNSGGGEFGFSVALSSDGTTALIGGPGDGAYNAGAAWAFVPAPATVPGAPTGVTAAGGDATATVSFTAPTSNGGAPISSYTVTSSPGGARASDSSSPISVQGLANGTSYTFTVTATNSAGTGPASVPSNAVTPAPPAAHGGGGGGGSDAISGAIAPSAQTVASAGTATWTVTITNTGAGYLFDVGASDAVAPGCDQATASTPAATLATLETMAPGVSVTYTCTLAGITGSLTNTVTDSGVGPDAATVTASASGSVTVSGSSAPLTPPIQEPVATTHGAKSPTHGVAATLSLTGLTAILLDTRKPVLRFQVKVSSTTTLTITLVDAKAHKLSRLGASTRRRDCTS